MVKRNILIVALLTIASLVTGGCQPAAKTSSSAGELSVLAVEPFLADIAQNVAGQRAAVDTLMPRGVDPHAFEPTPQDIARIADSQVLIINGAGLEEWLQETIQSAGGTRVLVEASAGLTSRAAREGEEAVMSPEEMSDQVCAALEGPVEEITAGASLENAANLHDEEGSENHEHTPELVTVKLVSSGGAYGGFVRFHVEEDGEYVFGAGGGAVAVLGVDGSRLEAEMALPLSCSGLSGGILLDLETGDYTVSLSGLPAETTPFLAAAAGGHAHHGSDPHFWLDPLSVIQYVENIRDGLIEADPAGQAEYTQNAARYIEELHELDVWIKQQVANIPEERRLIVTNHESFGYFADRYGFKIIGTVIPSVSTGATPSAQQMARLVDHIRQSGATVIFLETGSNPQLANQIAQEAGIKVVADLYTHSMSEANGPAPTYIDMMKANVEKITTALR